MVKTARRAGSSRRAASAAVLVAVGVDEAGRGPLAGPVVCAAVILKPRHGLRGLDDRVATVGGTLALAGFTLTVPATGTAALLGTAQTFSAQTSTAPLKIRASADSSSFRILTATVRPSAICP